MPDVTITGLPNAAALTGTERVPMDQAGVTVDAAASAIAGLATKATVGLSNVDNTSDANKPISTATATALAGKVGNDDARLTDAREWSAATVEQAEAEVGTSAVRRAWTAQRVRQAVAAWWAATASAAGQALATAADAAAQRLLLGLGATDSVVFADLAVSGTATLNHIHGALAGEVYQHVRADGVSLAALAPYHVVDSQGDTDRALVIAARADSASAMPAAGLVKTSLSANGDGHGVVAGVMVGCNTAGLVSGDPVYVAPTGGLTLTRPTTGLVQVVAIVGRVHASTGTLVLAVGPALPAWVYVDTTDAGNLSSGTLAAARLPASGVTANTYGSSSQVPVMTVDVTGRVTAVTLAPVSGGGGGAVRIDSTSTANTIYVGKAPAGSAESAAVWDITRTQFSAAGVQAGSGTVSAVTWTGRTSHSYP